MTDQGLDYAFPPHPAPSAIVAGGYVFVSRYLSYKQANTLGKILTPAEAGALLAAGIDIYLNWEFDALDCLRGAAGGTADATEAVRQAQALGYPRGATIYHSADFDVTDAQKPTVAEYLTAARAVESAAGYRTGCYSGYWTIKYMFDNAVIDDGWQAFAWSGGLWDARAALRQVQNGITVGGADCDLDERVGVAYSWLHPGGTVTQPSLVPQQVDQTVWYVTEVAHLHDTVEGGAHAGEPLEISVAIKAIQADVAAIKAALAALQPSTPTLVPHTHSISATTGAATATPTTTP